MSGSFPKYYEKTGSPPHSLAAIHGMEHAEKQNGADSLALSSLFQSYSKISNCYKMKTKKDDEMREKIEARRRVEANAKAAQAVKKSLEEKKSEISDSDLIGYGYQ